MKKGMLIYDSSTNRFTFCMRKETVMAGCTAELQWRP